MSEDEWLTTRAPKAMFGILVPDPWRMVPRRGRVSDRKLRLFACACCRSVLTVQRYDPGLMGSCS